MKRSKSGEQQAARWLANQEHVAVSGLVASHVFHRVDTTEEPAATLQPDIPLGDLIGLLGWADHYVAAATAVRQLIRDAVAAELGEGGSVRDGDRLIRYNRPNDWKLLDSFDAWAKENLTVADVLAILPRSSPRVTALREVAARYGMDEGNIEGTLLVNRGGDKEATVTATPIDRSPKYAAKMSDGEVRRGKPV